MTTPSNPEKSHQPAVAVGGVLLAAAPIEYNLHRPTVKIKVRNTGDRPIQVGSHFHFFEVNRYLQFDRRLAFGFHLNIPATTAIRFEPGDEKEVELVTYCGKSRLIGFNQLTSGYTGREDEPSYYPIRDRAFRRLAHLGFHDCGCPRCGCSPCTCNPCDCKDENCDCKEGVCDCKDEKCNCKDEKCNCNDEKCDCKEGACDCKDPNCTCNQQPCTCKEEKHASDATAQPKSCTCDSKTTPQPKPSNEKNN